MEMLCGVGQGASLSGVAAIHLRRTAPMEA